MHLDRIALCYPTRVDSATLSSPTPFVATLPLSNLQDRVFGHWARRDGTAALQINAAWPLHQRIGCVALAAHNLTTQATWRVRYYDDAANAGSDTGVVWDSGELFVWPTVYDQQDLEWEFNNFWEGTPADEDLDAFTRLAVSLTDPQIIRAVTVDVNDPANPDGYLQAGRLMLADLWQPAYHFSFGAQQGYAFGTTIEEALDGTEYFDERRSKRTFEFTLQGMDEADARGRSSDLMRRCGDSREVLVAAHQLGGPYQAEQTFIGRLARINPLTTVNFDWHEHGYSLVEIV